MISHTGGIPGFSTIFGFIPDKQTGVVVLSNADEKAREVVSVFLRALGLAAGAESDSFDVLPQGYALSLVSNSTVQVASSDPLSSERPLQTPSFSRPTQAMYPARPHAPSAAEHRPRCPSSTVAVLR